MVRCCTDCIEFKRLLENAISEAMTRILNKHDKRASTPLSEISWPTKTVSDGDSPEFEYVNE